ncbi:MAG: hypothetical protein ACOZQL_39435 [Myxococcota bacterium]
MRLIPALLGLVLGGCATLGAQALPEVQAAYNEKLSLTQDTQFLLNIVRLRYRDTPAFLDVASLTTQQTMGGSVGVGASVPSAPPAITVNPNLSSSMSVTPTTTFAPVRGDDFVKRLVAPISLQTVSMVASSGWSVGRVLQLTVDRLNQISNAPTATGPTPELPPDASRFITLTRALRALQIADRLSMSTVRDDGSGDSGILYFDDEASPTDPFRTVHELLDLPPEQTRIRLTEDFTRRDAESLRMRLRSVLGAMFFLSQAVEVPPEHEKAGLVTVTKSTDGGRFDWQKVLDGIFRVQWSATEPKAAAVKVKHRGTWFFVADDDLESKSTFMLLIQLFNMQAGRGALPVPLLTIPAGR